MRDYLVRWEIEIPADSPREAAELAQQMMPARTARGLPRTWLDGLGAVTTATLFAVTDPVSGEEHEIDICKKEER